MINNRPNTYIVIEDQFSRAELVFNALKRLPGRKVWLRVSNTWVSSIEQSEDDFLGRRFDEFKDLFEQTEITQYFSKVVANKEENSIVFLDYQLGSRTHVEVWQALRSMIDKSDRAGKTTIVAAYSHTAFGADSERGIERRDHTFYMALPTSQPSDFDNLVSKATSVWRERSAATSSVFARVWQTQAQHWFNSSPTVPHDFGSVSASGVETYETEINDYLQRFLQRDPSHSLEQREKKFLHEALKSLAGAHAKSDFYYRIQMENEKTNVPNRVNKDLTLGGVALLLACATYPHNNWFDKLKWDSNANAPFVSSQTPKQSFRLVKSLVCDSNEETGLFGCIRALESNSSVPGVNSAKFSANSLQIELSFPISRVGTQGKDSLKDIWSYDGLTERRGGKMTEAFYRMIDSIGRCKAGFRLKTGVSFNDHPKDTSKSILTFFGVR